MALLRRTLAIAALFLPLSAAAPAGAAECGLVIVVGCLPPSPTTTAPAPAPSAPAPAPSAPAPGPSATASSPSEAEPQPASSAAARLLQLANAERSAAGLPPLASRGDVAAVAASWSVEMAGAGTISHNDAFFGSAMKSRLGAKSRGENVGVAGDADDVHRRFMASAPHRANILNARFTVVGMGAARAADGQLYVTEAFVEPAGGPAPAAAAPVAAARPPATTTPARATTASTATAPARPPAAATAPASPAPAPEVALEQRPAAPAEAGGGSPARRAAGVLAVLTAVAALALGTVVAAGARSVLRTA